MRGSEQQAMFPLKLHSRIVQASSRRKQLQPFAAMCGRGMEDKKQLQKQNQPHHQVHMCRLLLTNLTDCQRWSNVGVLEK